MCCVQCRVRLTFRRVACGLCAVQSETDFVSLCTAHNPHAALRFATSPNLYNDLILPSVLT